MLLTKAVLVLCSVTAVLAQSRAFSHANGADAVASGALFIGKDTTESLDPLKVFLDPINHPAAVSSVLTFSADRSGFQPADKSAESLVGSYPSFIEQISTFPGFYLESSRQTSLSVENQTTVDQLTETFSRLITEEGGARKFAELVPLGLSQEEAAKLKTWLLSLLIVDKSKDDGSLYAKLLYTTVEIAYNKDPKTCHGPSIQGVFVPEQELRINRLELRVNTSFLIANANNLANLVKPIVDVEKMIAFFTSPIPNIPETEDRLHEWATQQKVLTRWFNRV